MSERPVLAVELYQKHYLRLIYTHVMRGLVSTAVSPLDLMAKTG